MKNLLIFFAALIGSITGFSQVKISDMPTFVGNPAGGWSPIVIAGVNRKIDPVYFGYNKLDVIFRKIGTDSLFTSINGANTFVTLIDTAAASVISSGHTFVVASQAAMLALSSAAIGDVAVRTDSSKSYILQTLPPSTLSNWVLLLFPTSVPSVFGRSGAITAQTGDYAYSQISGTPTIPDTSLLKHKVDSTLPTGYATQYDIGLKQDKGTNTLQTVTNNGNTTTNPVVTKAGFLLIPTGSSSGITIGFGSGTSGTISFSNASAKNVTVGNKKVDSSYNVEFPASIHQPATSFRTIPLSVNGQKADSLTGDISVSVGGTQIVDTTTQNGILKGDGHHVSVAGDADIRVAFGTQNTTYFLAGPTGTPGTSIWRAIVAADIPTLNQSTTGTAANLTAAALLPSGTTAAIQALTDSSAKLQTTAESKRDSLHATHVYKGEKFDTSSIPISYLAIVNKGATGDSLLLHDSTHIYAKKLIAGTNITLTDNADTSITINSSTASTNPQFISNGIASPNLFGVGTTSTANKFTIDSSGNIITPSGAKISTGTIALFAGGSITATGTNVNMTIQSRGMSSANSAILLGTGSHTNSTGLVTDVLINPTWNQTSTAAGTDLGINRIETAPGTGEQLLINGMVNSTSRWKVNNYGIKVPRILTTTSGATITVNSDTTDMFTVTALAAGTTFANPTGHPLDGQTFRIRVKDNGGAQTIAFGANFRGSTSIALPTTTTTSKTMYMQFIYNAADSKWDLIDLTNGF